ncbi:galactose-1-phosphate uridylyltransferase [Pullulanibacillus sp. KACC 23026]|uniref:galactose-1-phosphate uridylyltransferase n=1 Tax=Pullulanibacillus sp. KACC 23026 TaxID=3028315 RepID=UPI0023AF2FA8|nr:galactose-1-phosphate uridylyltransferase [Pullulanibacillus sp. KACC 23026]WEG12903.1 galactose-1-phosphate uridylyltransferase [Pullulanibacillus sp. KACC 23026]
MAELRYNPLLRDWTMVSAKRQNRPNMPKDFCPFCPGSGKVPDHYDVHLYHNDFPVLSENPPVPDNVGGKLYQTREAYGRCEVVLYSPDHHATIPDLPKENMQKLIQLWCDTFSELEKDPKHQYVMIFENRGEEVGVTMPHPHGQVYAYPFIPLKVKTELSSCQDYYEETGHNLFDVMIEEEKAFGERVILEGKTFIAYIPFFTDYPFGVHLVCKTNKTAITEFTNDEKEELGNMLQSLVGGMDCLYNRLFPYMMVMHQRPSNLEDPKDYYRFHIEFYPPLRDKDKIKYNASSETGGWAAANPTKVEETSTLLRDAIQVYLKKKG